jgi:hypothetical protein
MVAGKMIFNWFEDLGRAIFLKLLSQLWLTFGRPEDECKHQLVLFSSLLAVFTTCLPQERGGVRCSLESAPLGAGCLMVVVLTHIFETFHLLPWMHWGPERPFDPTCHGPAGLFCGGPSFSDIQSMSSV